MDKSPYRLPVLNFEILRNEFFETMNYVYVPER